VARGVWKARAITFSILAAALAFMFFVDTSNIPSEVCAVVSVLLLFLIKRKHPEEPWGEFLIFVPCLVVPLYLIDAGFNGFGAMFALFLPLYGEETRDSFLRDLGLTPRRGRYRWNVGTLKHDD